MKSKIKKRGVTAVICTVSPDRSKKIELCLRSLAGQPSTDFELVVVDGWPNDELGTMCNKYSDKLRIRRIKINKNNLAYSRNIAIKNAIYDIVSFLDDDAKAGQDWLSNIQKHFRINTKTSGVAGKILSASDHYLSKFAEIYVDYGQDPDEIPTIRGTNMILNIAKIKSLKGFRKKIFNEKFRFAGEETEACYYIRKKGGRLFYDPGIVVFHFYEKSLPEFFKKNFSYGVGDYILYKTNPLLYYDLMKKYLKGLNNILPLLFFPVISLIVVLKSSYLTTVDKGVYWLPAILLRETAYTLGIYSALLKSEVQLHKLP